MNAPILATLDVALDHPWALLALVAAAGPWAIAARARRRGQTVSTLSVLVQSLAVALAAIALAGPAAPLGPGSRLPWLVMTDVSVSATGQYDTPLSWDADVPRTDTAFAAGVFPDARSVADPDRLATDAAAALQAAAGRAGRISGVIVRTDGRFNGPDDWRASATALARAIARREVLIVPMALPARDARVSSIIARRQLDGTVRIEASLAASVVVNRTLRIERLGTPGNTTLLKKTFRLEPDIATLATVDDAPPPGEAVTYRATLDGTDAITGNDSARITLIPPTRRVAVIGTGPVAAAMQKAFGATVVRLTPADAPTDLDGYLAFALVVVADDTGAALTADRRAALAKFVRGGGGLLLAGSGPRTTYADRDDPLNRTLPLLADPYRRKPLAITVALDASGSMAAGIVTPSGRRRKFDRAAQAVLELQKHLTPADSLSVITFADKATKIYDSGDGPPEFAALSEAMFQVKPAGRTEVGGALTLAAATPTAARKGLVIVVSDLVTLPFDADAAAARLQQAGQNLAVVAIATGDTPDAAYPLEALAARLKATLVRRTNLDALAEVFVRFLSDARGVAVRRGTFTATFVDRPLDVAIGSAAAITTYIASAAADGADVLGRIGTDAILARRQVGLGRSVAVAIASGPNENTAWWSSPQAGQLLAAAARWAMPTAADGRFSGRVQPRGHGMHLQIDARDESGPVNLLSLTARVANAPPQPLKQTRLGRYEALLPTVSGADLQVVDADGKVCWRHHLAQQTPPELLALGPHWATLRELATRTGGKIVAAEELVVAASAVRREASHPLWPYFLGLALLMMLGEWVVVRA